MLRTIRSGFNIFGLSLYFFCLILHATPPQEAPAPKPAELTLGPVAVPVIQKGKLACYYVFEVLLICPDPQTGRKVTSLMLAVIDRVLTTTYSAASAFWTPQTPLTQAQLQTLISRELSALVPPHHLQDIQLKNFRILRAHRPRAPTAPAHAASQR